MGLHKAFVLLSGGIDSSTVAAIARHQFPCDDIECVTVDYGQRHIREMDCALYQAEQIEANHSTLRIPGLLTGMLVEKGDDNQEIPNADYADLPEGISPTYVSFRNGTMLSLLAAKAQSWVMEQQQEHDEVSATLYCGVHADDAARDAYPDCTLEFIGAMASAIQIGTYGKVRLRAPIVALEKSAVIEWGEKLRVNYGRTWSCYVGDDLHCGVCPTCRARKTAFEQAGVTDPTAYEA